MRAYIMMYYCNIRKSVLPTHDLPTAHFFILLFIEKKLDDLSKNITVDK